MIVEAGRSYGPRRVLAEPFAESRMRRSVVPLDLRLEIRAEDGSLKNEGSETKSANIPALIDEGFLNT